MRSVVSAFGASASGMWMVTGATASARDQIIMTGKAGAAPGLGQFAQKFRMTRETETGLVEHSLGDRIGGHGAGLAVAHRFDARVIDSIVAAALPASGRPGSARDPISSGTTGRARSKIRRNAAGSVSMIGASIPSASPAPEQAGRRKNEERRVARRPAARLTARVPDRCRPDRRSSWPEAACRLSSASARKR